MRPTCAARSSWHATRTTNGRSALFGAIGDLFDETEQQFSDQELALVDDILEALQRGREVDPCRPRREKLAHAKSRRRWSVEMLGNDGRTSPRPSLTHSELPPRRGADRVVHRRSRQHRLAVAVRARLSSGCCDALVEFRRGRRHPAPAEDHGARIRRRPSPIWSIDPPLGGSSTRSPCSSARCRTGLA